MKIIQDYIDIPAWDAHPMNPKYITVHTTRNLSKGANAKMHARYLHNTDVTQKRWHETIDEDYCVRHIPHNINAWASGDGLNGTGNRQSIQIEICENEDGNFDKAVSNAITRIQQLMSEHNIPLANVVPHKRWSGKDCPHVLLKDWNSFIDRVGGKKAYTPPKTEVKTEVVGKGNVLILPANEDSWRVYPTNVSPVKGNEKGFLNPKKFGGLEYDILRNPQANVYTIQTSDFGKVNIYAAPSTGAKVSKKKTSNDKYLNLHKHMKEWGIYRLNATPIKRNQFAQLKPSKFGGLSYKVLGNPQANVYTIQTEDFGKVNIYAPRDKDSSITNSPLY
jgi:N-acetylmuramoyl-L-alanine amidase